MEAVLKELIKHGDENFNFGVYPHDMSYGLSFPTHWHSEYEIIYMKKGSMSVLLDGKQYMLQEKQAILVDKYAIHAYVGDEQHTPDTEHVDFVFGEKFLFPDSSSRIYKEYFEPIYTSGYTFIPMITQDKLYGGEVVSLLDKLDRICKDGTSRGLAIQIYLLSIMNILIEQKAYVKTSYHMKSTNDIVKSAMLAINYNYTDNSMRIKEISDSLNVSVEYLIRLFKKTVGMTPKEYVINLRIHKSKLLIKANEDITISEIAYMSGFDDMSYFSRIFKSKTGTSPSDYKKTIQCNNNNRIVLKGR